MSESTEEATPDEMDFSDLSPVEIPVVGPDKVNYILREASADAAVKYRNASAKAGKWEDGKVVGFENVADCEVLLVSLCLCETEGGLKGKILLGRNGAPVTVPEARVRQWPQRVVGVLFDKIVKISPNLIKQTPEEKKKVKPSPEDGTDTSSSEAN